MLLLIVNYTELPEKVTPHAASHGAWVKQHIDDGTFLFAGPKKNKLGGVILAKSNDKTKLLDIIAKDSYVIADVAEYQIIDFDCKLASPELELLTTI